jgi:hypothetical protein
VAPSSPPRCGIRNGLVDAGAAAAPPHADLAFADFLRLLADILGYRQHRQNSVGYDLLPTELVTIYYQLPNGDVNRLRSVTGWHHSYFSCGQIVTE